VNRARSRVVEASAHRGRRVTLLISLAVSRRFRRGACGVARAW
jgi:hypothetical protein